MKGFEAGRFWGKCNFPFKKKRLEICAFYTALISIFHIVSEVKAL